MGIGMLDSEESSSSAASSIALVLSASADENSNGVTPNLDAPKMCHNHIASYRPLDSTLDSTLSSENNTIIGSPNISHIEPECSNANHQHCNNNNNNTLDSFGDESKQTLLLQQCQSKNVDKVLPQYRKVAILGVGAGSSSSSASASQPNVTNSNSNSPSAGRSTRSPLATVSGNNHNRTVRNASQHESIGGNGIATINNSTNPNPILYASNYMPMPSTSKQITLIKQQQRQQLQQQQLQRQVQNVSQHQQKQKPNEQHPHMALYDNFFLFRQQQLRDHVNDGKDHFSSLSDEIILQIFKWLPKKALIRCSYVCRRFGRCASDESLWTRLDLGGRHLRAGALESILTRGVVILRLAQAELNHPIFDSDFLHAETKFESKLQYLDLSMVSVTKPSLKMLLSRCRQLKKLSLEHVPINDEICNEIAKNANLEALNLAMCIGLEAWSVRKIMESLQNLNSLNISWTNLSVDAVTSVVTNVTPNLMRLNMAGCRKTLYDSHVASLAKRCPQLLEIDFSDCTALTGSVVNIICRFKMLEYLSLSRCYLIPASSYMDLINLPTLTYLDIFGMLSDTGMELLEQNFPNIGINKFIHSSVARPTVGTRRTSIWGLRTRD
ncbi:PREDICTED: S-phase kinase-associated protein 2 isoform X3 [Rhagoletis zephyria]|nr:PREDICTED: S-phase kinase-associated protein 2 isoform X3 [Rhagoletis zephyria]XP_017474443.1 PREDICTED: S-phase kinase-associated protein 2 isoform X3 [Rhagoletis zephyria]XP_017474444.1 PREDICTED: S-phase kinase-associated protein 2 isoform X3 [Rhagoletis zephyria]